MDATRPVPPGTRVCRSKIFGDDTEGMIVRVYEYVVKWDDKSYMTCENANDIEEV